MLLCSLTILLSVESAMGQVDLSQPIAEATKVEILNTVEYQILWYRAALCSEIDFERFVTRSYANDVVTARRNPKEIFLQDSLPKDQSWSDYHMILSITRWPEDHPKRNAYLVKKQGIRFTNGKDTLSFDICNDRFQYDERYVVYYKEGSIPQVVSGNAFPTISYPFVNKSKRLNLAEAQRLAYFRMGQFEGSLPEPFPRGSYETDSSFQFKVDHSLLNPQSVLVNVAKADSYNTLEVVYYTNDTTVTQGDIHSLYEVKHTLSVAPGTYEETLPVVTKLENRQFLNEKIKNESREWSHIGYFIDTPPIIREKKITIEGKIDSVYLAADPIIIVVDQQGNQTKIPYEIATDYLISGKGKLQIRVKENGQIIREDNGMH